MEIRTSIIHHLSYVLNWHLHSTFRVQCSYTAQYENDTRYGTLTYTLLNCATLSIEISEHLIKNEKIRCELTLLVVLSYQEYLINGSSRRDILQIKTSATRNIIREDHAEE